MNNFEKELISNVANVSRKEAITALANEFVFSNYYCDEREVAAAAKKLGLDDSMIPAAISKLNVVAMSARGGNPDAIKKAEELKAMLPEIVTLVDRIIEDAKQQAKDYGYKEADGFINVGTSMENIKRDKELAEQEAQSRE